MMRITCVDKDLSACKRGVGRRTGWNGLDLYRYIIWRGI